MYQRGVGFHPVKLTYVRGDLAVLGTRCTRAKRNEISEISLRGSRFIPQSKRSREANDSFLKLAQKWAAKKMFSKLSNNTVDFLRLKNLGNRRCDSDNR